MHIVYREDNYEVIGINLFGTRHRHDVWDRWLHEKRSLQYVIEHLAEANFDPEFFKTYEHKVAEAYAQQVPNKPIKFKRKKRFLDFLGA